MTRNSRIARAIRYAATGASSFSAFIQSIISISENWALAKNPTRGSAGVIGALFGVEDNSVGANEIHYGLVGISSFTGDDDAAAKFHVGVAGEASAAEGSGVINALYGVDAAPIIYDGSTGNVVIGVALHGQVIMHALMVMVVGAGVYIEDAVNDKPGILQTLYGVKIDAQTKGSVANWGLHSATKNFLGEGAVFGEIADPDAPAADGAHLYCKDNGAGKTQLCVRFATGAVQVIATEP